MPTTVIWVLPFKTKRKSSLQSWTLHVEQLPFACMVIWLICRNWKKQIKQEWLAATTTTKVCQNPSTLKYWWHRSLPRLIPSSSCSRSHTWTWRGQARPAHAAAGYGSEPVGHYRSVGKWRRLTSAVQHSEGWSCPPGQEISFQNSACVYHQKQFNGLLCCIKFNT